MIFFVHWSSTSASYRDMERRMATCQRCSETVQHTIRYHTTQTKHYSVVSFGGGDKALSVICHGCLLEMQIPQDEAKLLIAEYDNQLAAAEAGALIDENNHKKAEKKLRKILKKNPDHAHSRFMLARCFIEQSRKDEAEPLVRRLESDYPDDDEVKNLRNTMSETRGALR